MQKKSEFFDSALKLYFFVITSVLLFGFIYLFQKINSASPSNPIIEPTSQEDIGLLTPRPSQATFECGQDCKEEIQKEVAKQISSLPTTAPKNISPASPTKTQTSYIPLTGPITTTSTDWIDAPGTDVYVDRINDYGKGAAVSWESSLKVANANGQAYARLFDVTHGIAVSGSEIYTIDNDGFRQASSGNLNLWAGRNLYRVQLKSLNSFEVTFGSGRIKITY